MTRVLFFSQAPGVGGGERVALEALARSDQLSTTVVAPDPVVRFAYRLGLPGVVLEFPRAHRLLDVPRAGWGGLRLRRIARRLRSEVLYANGTRAFPYGIAARVSGGPPLVAHHHGILTAGPTRTLISGLRRWAAEVVVPSYESARPFGDGELVRVVRNGVNLDHFRPSPNREPGHKVVGTVARFSPGKGLESFIRVARIVGDADAETSFLLAGGTVFPGSEVELGVVDRLSMTGYLDDPLSAYQSMDIFLHLSKPEGFPLTAIEAMACGLPVIAYRWGGVAEVFDHGVDGFLIEPNDEAAVADLIRTLLHDEVLRRQIGKRARVTCEERFDLERMAGELSAIVGRAAG